MCTTQGGVSSGHFGGQKWSHRIHIRSKSVLFGGTSSFCAALFRLYKGFLSVNKGCGVLKEGFEFDIL